MAWGGVPSPTPLPDRWQAANSADQSAGKLKRKRCAWCYAARSCSHKHSAVLPVSVRLVQLGNGLGGRQDDAAQIRAPANRHSRQNKKAQRTAQRSVFPVLISLTDVCLCGTLCLLLFYHINEPASNRSCSVRRSGLYACGSGQAAV